MALPITQFHNFTFRFINLQLNNKKRLSESSKKKKKNKNRRLYAKENGRNCGQVHYLTQLDSTQATSCASGPARTCSCEATRARSPPFHNRNLRCAVSPAERPAPAAGDRAGYALPSSTWLNR